MFCEFLETGSDISFSCQNIASPPVTYDVVIFISTTDL